MGRAEEVGEDVEVVDVEEEEDEEEEMVEDEETPLSVFVMACVHHCTIGKSKTIGRCVGAYTPFKLAALMNVVVRPAVTP